MFVIIRPAAKQVFQSQMHWLIEKAKGVTFFPKRPLPPQFFSFLLMMTQKTRASRETKVLSDSKKPLLYFPYQRAKLLGHFSVQCFATWNDFLEVFYRHKKDASIWKQWSFIELLQLPFYYLFMIEGREKTDGRQILWRLTSRFRPSSRLINKGEKKVRCCRQISVPRNIIGVFRHVEKLLPCFALGISQMIWGLYWRPTFRRHIPEEMKKKSAKHTLCFNKSP